MPSSKNSSRGISTPNWASIFCLASDIIKENRHPNYDISPQILNRYSPRALNGEELSDDDLFPLFEAARWAPSSYNNQPWRFIVAKRQDKEAFDKLFGLNLNGNSLVEFAGSGEKASAGSVHYDNVAASVLGGFVIVKTDPLDVIRVEPPTNLRMCIAVPDIDVPKKKTKVSRGLIPKKIKLTDSVLNLSNAAAIVAGFMRKDPELIGNSIKDVIVEPARQHMIPGFAKVKQNALKAGALGVTISGAGPSVIAFSKSSADLKKISLAMSRGFASKKIKCQTIICKPSKGAADKRKS